MIVGKKFKRVSHPKWTDEEVERVRHVVAQMPTAASKLKKIREMFPKLPRNTVYDRAQKLGLVGGLKARKHFTMAELETVRRRWLAGDRLIDIAFDLGRSDSVVGNLTKRMGLPRRPKTRALTDGQIAVLRQRYDNLVEDCARQFNRSPEYIAGHMTTVSLGFKGRKKRKAFIDAA